LELFDSNLTSCRISVVDYAFISEDDSQTGKLVEIVDSGTLRVTEGASDDNEDNEGGEGELCNTDTEPDRRTLSDGESITVNSS
jgi:hypothetical protein